MLLLTAFGYSANLAIYYVMFASVIEGLFIFLIIERISSTSAAIIGTVMFAFLPLDVLFATHVQPLVPAIMAVTISFYLFIVASEKDRKLPYLLSGIFAGLAFITNPLGAVLLLFLVLTLIVRLIRARGKAAKRARYTNHLAGLALVALGFFAAYAPIGMVYLTEADNFLLYPTMTHAVYAYRTAVSPTYNYFCLTSNVCLVYIELYPPHFFYLLGDLPVSYNYLRYFGMSAYAFVALAALCVFAGRNNRWLIPFILMFAFYLLALNAVPLQESYTNGVLLLYPMPEVEYLTTILTLPLIVVSALGLERLFKQKRPLLSAIAIVLLVAILAYDIIDLNHDIGFYRTSIAPVHYLVDYAASHPNETVYTEGTMSLAANLLSGYHYSIQRLVNCSAAYLDALPKNAVISTGGTVGFALPPEQLASYDLCVAPNLTAYKEAYSYGNPYDKYSPSAPPLVIHTR